MCYLVVRQLSKCGIEAEVDILDELWIYLIGALVVVDIIIVVAGVVPCLFGAKIGYRWRKLLWLILVVRLLIPVRVIMNQIYVERPSYFVQIDIPAEYGAEEQLDQAEHEKAQEIKDLEIQEDTENMDTDELDSGEILPAQQSAVTQSFWTHRNQYTNVKWILLLIWVFGVLALTVHHVIDFLKVRELIKVSSHACADQHIMHQMEKLCEEYGIKTVPHVIVCSQIRSPMLFGYRRTQLLLPDREYNETEMRMILRHELQHKKSGDLWYKLLIMFVCDLYWFNPVLLLMKRLAYQDVECVCDARVLRGLTTEEKKLYGNIVLNNMAGDWERVIVYGTSIFTGKRAAKLRIKNMFTQKNKLGFVILGVLTLCAAVGSSMWVLSEQNGEKYAAPEQNPLLGDMDYMTEDAAGGDSEYRTEQIAGKEMEQAANQPDADRVLADNTVIVEDMEDIGRAENLNCANCYTTELIRGGNHYWIDEQGTLWGTGQSENGQLMEVREDLSRITEPVQIAQHVKHVDFSGEYFVIYLTENNQLYGLGTNLALVLHLPMMEDYQFIITEPVLVMENVVYAKCGYSTIIALTENGEVYMRGEGKYIPSGTYSDPRKVMENAKYVTAYDNTFAVIDNNDSLWTWGGNRFGQCGVGYFSEQVQSPQKVMEHVECAWMGRAAFNSTDEVGVRAKNNLIVLMKDGTFYGCGEGIGEEQLPGGINELDEAQEVTASEELVPVSIQE